MELDLSLSLRPPQIQKLDNESFNDVDFISRLPNELLTRIISLLSEQNAQATTILSKRWKEVWAFLPDLRFVMPYCDSETEAKQFMDFIHRILIVRDGTELRKFSLFLSRNCDYARAYEFICDVIRCNVKAFDLRFPGERVKVKFPWNHFKSLVSLTLRGEFVLDVPENVLFPSLKALTLLSVIYSGEASIVNLFSGCPVLEKLHVERHLIGVNNSDNVMTFNLSVPSLRLLYISFAQSKFGEHKLVMNAPNLERLHLIDRITLEFAFGTLPSIVSAIFHVEDGNAIGLLQSVSATRSLTLGGSTMTLLGIAENINDTPLFENLVTLRIACDYLKGWRVLTTLLHKMPNLENLIFHWGLVPPRRSRSDEYEFNFFPPANVPACLLSKLKIVAIFNNEALTEEELPLIRYLLRFGKTLQAMDINSHDIHSSLKRRLLRYCKGSKSCQINLR